MKKIIKRVYTSSLLLAATGCFAIAAVISLFFSTEKISVVKAVSSKISVTPSPLLTESETIVAANTTEETSSVASPTLSSPTASPVKEQEGFSQSTPTQIATPKVTPAKQTFTVSLSVNGSGVGDVTLEEGANQCDVLTQAQEQGKISNLLMKYDNSLGTYGVYQINGMGKETSVWWVYNVNGQSPSQGCSYISAKNGDSVEWEYKGN